jgi:Mrp family chromosome partitioning ATPase/capsular polysaccharide biosynthesis protein
MESVHYARILRRRIKLILGCTIVGALLGLASTALIEERETTKPRYLAQHILLDDSSAEAPMNLGKAQLLLTTGEVPERVAEQVDIDPTELARRVTITADQANRTITVTAVTPTPELAELLADSYADIGVEYLIEQDRQERDEDLAGRRSAVERLEGEIAQLETDLAAAPPEQQDAIRNEIQTRTAELSTRQQEIEVIENEPLPSEQLETLDDADAIQVTPSQVNELLNQPAEERRGEGGNSTSPIAPIRGGVPEPQTPIADEPGLRTAAGGIVGLIAGIVIAFVLARLDPTIRTKEEAEESFGLPVIAEIPPLPRSESDRTAILAFDAPRSPTAEAYRGLRSALVIAGGATRHGEHFAEETEAKRAQVILVTSPGPSEGKTTTAANLAVVIAETGYSVLAINCDFRRPRLHRYLRAKDTPRRVIETGVPGVRTITDVVSDSSRLNPAEVVAAQRQVIEGARDLFDVIVLDTAPLLSTNDATDILPEADLVVVCCRVGKSSREAAVRTTETLRRYGAPVAGVTLVGADEGPSASYYYYYGADRHTGRKDTDGNGSRANGSGSNGSTAKAEAEPERMSRRERKAAAKAEARDRGAVATVADEQPTED